MGGFFDRLERMRSVQDAIDILDQRFEILYVSYHVTSFRQLDVDQPYIRTTYPEKWVARYLLKGYVTLDPVIKKAMQTTEPFFWEELALTTPAELAFFQDAEQHGVGQSGLSIPIDDSCFPPAVFSVSSHLPPQAFRDQWTENQIAALMRVSAIVHRIATEFELHAHLRPPKLTPREVECIKWTSRGKDAVGISIILGLSEHTIRGYLKSARYKLCANTLSQAVHTATHFKIIRDYD